MRSEDEEAEAFERSRGQKICVYRGVTLHRAEAATRGASEMLEILRRGREKFFDGNVLFEKAELEFYTGTVPGKSRLIAPDDFEVTDSDRHVLLRREVVLVEDDPMIGAWLAFSEVMFTNGPGAQFHRPRKKGDRTPEREFLADLCTFALAVANNLELGPWLLEKKLREHDDRWRALGSTDAKSAARAAARLIASYAGG